MRVKLNKRWVKYLSNFPESGMGYQVVNVKLKNGNKIKSAIVYNSQILELPGKTLRITPSEIESISMPQT
jgi:hypothetical protein